MSNQINSAIELSTEELDLVAGGYSYSPVYAPAPPNPASGVITTPTDPPGSVESPPGTVIIKRGVPSPGPMIIQ